MIAARSKPAVVARDKPLTELIDIRDRLRRGETLTTEQSNIIASAVDKIEAGERADAALGLAVSFGRRPSTRMMHIRRARLLREIAARHYVDASTAAAADAIASAWARYAASAWPRERDLTECPARYAGGVRETLWKVMKLQQSSEVLSARRIRKILATNVRCSRPTAVPKTDLR